MNGTLFGQLWIKLILHFSKQGLLRTTHHWLFDIVISMKYDWRICSCACSFWSTTANLPNWDSSFHIPHMLQRAHRSNESHLSNPHSHMIGQKCRPRHGFILRWETSNRATQDVKIHRSPISALLDDEPMLRVSIGHPTTWSTPRFNKIELWYRYKWPHMIVARWSFGPEWWYRP